MAVTRISDVIVPQIFYNYLTKDTMEKTALFRSGILKADSELGAKLAGGGRTFNVPMWGDLDNTEGGIASDDPAVLSTPGKLGSLQDIARRQLRTRSWSTADLSGVLAGSDPMQRIRERVSDYWNRQFQRTLVATLKGVAASNIANNSGDMVHDIGTDAAGAPADAELISAEALIDAKQTMGDAGDVLKTLIVHSEVESKMLKNDLIDFTHDSEGKIAFKYYMGYQLVVDDGVGVTVGTNRTKYDSYLVGPGAFGWAESPAPTPVEVFRNPDMGNGMGVETLYTRRQYALHPYGIKFTDTSVAGEFPTNTELTAAGNWSRVYPERKQVPIVFLRTNG